MSNVYQICGFQNDKVFGIHAVFGFRISVVFRNIFKFFVNKFSEQYILVDLQMMSSEM